MSGCTQEDGLSRFQVPAELKFCEGAAYLADAVNGAG